MTDLNRAFLQSEDGSRLAKKVPMRRFAAAEELSAALIFLLDPQNSYMTGETLTIDGGMGLAFRGGRIIRIRNRFYGFFDYCRIAADAKRVETFVADEIIPLESDPAHYDAYGNIQHGAIAVPAWQGESGWLWAPQIPTGPRRHGVWPNGYGGAL